MFNRKLKEEIERLRWKTESLEDQLKDAKKQLEDALKATRAHLLAVKRGEEVSDEAVRDGLAFDRLTPEQLQTLIKKHPETVLLDVRTQPEVNMGYIPGAVHISIDQLSYRVSELFKTPEDKRKPIVAYCASGARSEVACETLVQNGFEKVFNFSAGVGAYPGKLETPVRGNSSPHVNLETDNPDLFNRVQDLLTAEINPAVANHGGSVALVAVHKQKAYLRFGGGCQGCGMVDVTLKQGIVKRIQESVEGIEDVIDLTDHSSGATPYFAPSAAH